MANRNRLQCVIDDLEELLREKAEIDERIKERKKEAKAEGFSVKTIDTVLKRRKKKPEVVAEEDELVDLYEANIDGRELGSAGRRRLERTRREEQPDLFTGDDGDDDDASASSPRPSDQSCDDSEDIARGKGAAAATAGQKVTSNPYPAGSPQRGWWDDAWCAASGSDGMDIPDAFKPTPKPRKEKPSKGGSNAPDGSEGGDE